MISNYLLDYLNFSRTMTNFKKLEMPAYPRSLSHWAELFENPLCKRMGRTLSEFGADGDNVGEPLFWGIIGIRHPSLLFMSDYMKE